MTQSNKHFDDLISHATVEWFVSQLSSADNLTSHPDALYKDLNAARFIDSLRQRVEEDTEKGKLFDCIKDIAKKLKEEEKWKDFSNLSVVLLSIARKFLESQESVREEPLYCNVENIYNTFKDPSDSCNSDPEKCDFCEPRSQDMEPPDYCESRFLVFTAGCQLLHFQGNEWQREFADFKTLYRDEISKFRMHYFLTDNPTEFARRVVSRWKRINDEDEASPQKFKELQDKFGDLNPMRLELPILARSAQALKFADNFVQDLVKEPGEDQILDEKIAKEFRIIQWEVMIRNLVEENMKGTLHFQPITDEHNVAGMPDLKNVVIPFIKEARKIEHHFIPLDGEVPRKRAEEHGDKDSQSIEKPIFVSNDLDETDLENCRKAFGKLLPKVNDYSSVHSDLVQSFANTRERNESVNAMLIEDGELSFFCLLWLLRYAAGKGEQPKNWESDPNKELTVRFRPSDDESDDNWWSSWDMYKFAEECGLIIPISESECIPTRRWKSLITWLRRLNADLTATDKIDKKHLQECEEREEPLKYDDPLIRRLPVKELDYNEPEEIAFINSLQKFFVSDLKKDMLDELNELSGVSMYGIKFAKKHLGGLVESLDSLLEVKSSVGLEDTGLLRCCRVPFIPLECLFRAYQPCKLHLLIQALNWEESPLGDWNHAPISLGFASIVGRVETSDNSYSVSKWSQSPTNFDYWLAPYRSLFSGLSANFSLAVMQDIGSLEQQTDFVHQTMGLLDDVWLAPERDKLNSRSEFALWLARTQVKSVWGSIPIDTTESIYQNFSQWESLNPKQIVDELVNLGLWGGIRRAARVPEDGDLNNPAWELTHYAQDLQMDYAEETIYQMLRDELSFKLPTETDPPDWVTTTAFAMCFYHGMRQALYHALETFVLTDEKTVREEAPCLWIEWKDQSVSIYNRGEVNPAVHLQDFKSNDRGFFNRFVEKTDEFCRENGIVEKFKINGPEPVSTAPSDDTWQLVIRKEE